MSSPAEYHVVDTTRAPSVIDLARLRSLSWQLASICARIIRGKLARSPVQAEICCQWPRLPARSSFLCNSGKNDELTPLESSKGRS
jgi:hypothetical protein